MTDQELKDWCARKDRHLRERRGRLSAERARRREEAECRRRAEGRADLIWSLAVCLMTCCGLGAGEMAWAWLSYP
jgi:hypothetical protein